MNKEFVSYERAVALRELGFDEPCLGYYTHNTGIEMNKLGLTTHPTRNTNSDISWVNKLYEGDVTAPLKQQVFRWFREKYNLRGFIGFRPNVKKFDYHIYDMSLSGMEYVKQRTMEEFNKDPKVGTYEEAENACIDKLIELAK